MEIVTGHRGTTHITPYMGYRELYRGGVHARSRSSWVLGGICPQNTGVTGN